MPKDRITVGLLMNADGSEKLKPLVIGKAKNPRAFKDWNVGNIVHFYSNPKAWMTSEVFKDWAHKINCMFAFLQRNVIILLDNASSHDWPHAVHEAMGSFDTIVMSCDVQCQVPLPTC